MDKRRTESVCNSSHKREGFSGGPGDLSFKTNPQTMTFLNTQRKIFDKSLKNRQVQEKVKFELGRKSQRSELTHLWLHM